MLSIGLLGSSIVIMGVQSTLQQFINQPFIFLFQIFQYLLDRLLSPTPPAPSSQLSRPKIAIIGAGLTGVSSASHCVGHGFDVTIFEAGERKHLGGIWAKVRQETDSLAKALQKAGGRC